MNKLASLNPRLQLSHRHLRGLAQHSLQPALPPRTRETGTGQALTVCCWFCPADLEPIQVLLNWGHRTADEPGWSIFLREGKLIASLRAGDTVITMDAPLDPTEAWQHVAVVIDTTVPALTAYLDASPALWRPIDMRLKPVGETGGHAGFMIGGYTDAAGGHFNYTFGRRPGDRLDDLRLYDRALTQDEIDSFRRNNGPSPIARFAIAAGSSAPTTVVLDASASTASAGKIIARWWTLGDGTQAEGVQVTHAYAHGGRYPIGLTVLDDQHRQAHAEQNLDLAGPEPPIRFTAVFGNGEAGYAGFRIPSIVAAANGDLVAFAEGRLESVSDSTRTIRIVCKRSTDQGRTWSALQVVGRAYFDGEEHAAMYPTPVVESERGTGRIILIHIQTHGSEWELVEGKGDMTVACLASDDHGVSWRTLGDITNQVHRPNRWRIQRPTAGHAIQLRGTPEHSYLRGRLFLIGSHTTGDDSVFEQHNYAFWSDDLGESWEIGPAVATRADGTSAQGLNEAMAVELDDGSILINSRNYQHGRPVGCRAQTVGAFDQDGQLHFQPTRHVPALIEPPCQASIIRVADPDRDASVLLFANPAHVEARVNMTVRLSRDGGKSWPVTRVVDPGPSAYSDLVVQADGDIGLLYERGNDGGIWYASFGLGWVEEAQAEVEARPEGHEVEGGPC